MRGKTVQNLLLSSWCGTTHDDNEADELGVGPLSTLASDDVPLLGGADDDLSGRNLLLVQLVVARQLTHRHSVRSQTLESHTERDNSPPGHTTNHPCIRQTYQWFYRGWEKLWGIVNKTGL